jgi:hypothetical protein
VAFVDLSAAIPAGARWIKVRYRMTSTSQKPLVARLWSGNPASAVIVKGSAGDAFVRLDVPQTLSYERASGVDLQLKVIAYKLTE